MSKNVAVFVDVANIFYAAKAAGADIDYVTLLKAAVAGRDFVRAYAYTGLDPENENQRNFHSFLARNNYKVVSKDIRKYGDGKVSEVPPELEELLRAQLATKLSRPAGEQPVGGRTEGVTEATTASAAESGPAAEAAAKPAVRRGGRRKAEAAPEQGQMAEATQAAAPEAAAAEAPAEVAKPATRTRRKPAAPAAAAETAAPAEAPAHDAESAEPSAPKRRAPARRKAVTVEPAGE